MSSEIFPIDEFFNEEEHFIFLPPPPIVKPPFPEQPILDGPHGGLLPDWAYEMAMFLVKASLLQPSQRNVLAKMRTLLRFQEWQTNRILKQKKRETPPIEDPCLDLLEASPQELDELLSFFCNSSKKKEFLSYLKVAVVLARVDSRFYIPKKETIEKLLHEMVTFDESLKTEQKEEIKALTSTFAERYSQALLHLYETGVFHKDTKEIQKILLLVSQEKETENTASRMYIEHLADLLSLGTALKEAYQHPLLEGKPIAHEKASIYNSFYVDQNLPATDSFFSTTAFLVCTIKSAIELHCVEQEVVTLLQQAPAFLALGIDQKEKIEKCFLTNSNQNLSSSALTEAINSTLALLTLRKMAFPFIELKKERAIAPLLILDFLAQKLINQTKEATLASLAAWCTYLGFIGLVEILLDNQEPPVGHLSLWEKPCLTPETFLLKLYPTAPSCSYQTWCTILFSAPSSIECYSSIDEAFRLFPTKKQIDIDSLLKKIVATGHIRNKEDSITTLVATIDGIIESVFNKRLTCIQLYQAAWEQAAKIRSLTKKQNGVVL